jgi:hypothetical protein
MNEPEGKLATVAYELVPAYSGICAESGDPDESYRRIYAPNVPPGCVSKVYQATTKLSLLNTATEGRELSPVAVFIWNSEPPTLVDV